MISDPHYCLFTLTESISVASVMDEVAGNSSNLNVEYDATNDRLRIYLANSSFLELDDVDMDNYEVNSTITLAGNASFNAQNGRSFVVLDSQGTGARNISM